MNKLFSLECRDCPRLARHLGAIRRRYPGYHAKPVPAFGEPNARLLIVGLAPGTHGANRSGRPFTGDYAGILLYRSLHKFGFANKPESVESGDGLRLIDCRITNAVKCLPPENKPELSEIYQCNKYLRHELKASHELTAVLALGTVAHFAVLKALDLKPRDFPFSHGGRHVLPNGLVLWDSYHCSRYNTQTKRLTATMFEGVLAQIREFI